MGKKIILLFFVFFALPFVSSLAQGQNLPVTIDADQISFLQQKNQIIAEGNVVIEHKEVKVFCDKAIYDAESNKAQIIGEAKIVQEGTTAYGKDIVYDFNLLKSLAEEIRVSQPPIYGKAEHLEEEDEKFILKEGYVTTCELDEPHYRLVSKSVTIYPGERVVARNMVLKIGNFPIFYFPYFSQSLKDDAFPIEYSPGKKSDWGYYLLTRLRYNLDNKNRGRLIFDWYEKRGQGIGISHQLETKDYGEAVLRFYRIQDELYRIEKKEEFSDRYPSRSREDYKSSRYKTQFFYDWRPTNRFFLVSELHKFSDEHFMQDFFEREYDISPRPRSYLLASYSLNNSRLSLRAQKRVNRFFSETEYLPQLEYNFYRQQLGRSNFYFESLDKLGYLGNTIKNSGETDNAFRVYSDNILSYRNRIAWLSVNPYAGVYSAYYSRGKLGEKDILRVTPKMGVTLNTRLYKIFDTSFSLLGERIEKMRHILIPEIRYNSVLRPNKSNREIFQFDKHDDTKRRQSLVFRLNNRLQARNEERTWDFIYFSPAVEYRIRHQGLPSRFENIKADLEIYPTRNISFNSDANYDLRQRYFSRVNADLTFNSRQTVEIDEQLQKIERPRYSVSLGHRYRRNDTSLGTLDITYNLTPKLKFKNYIRYEYATGDFEKQQYALRFDLHCWWMDIGVDLNLHERGGKDTTVWMAFRLKAFPEIEVDFSQTFDGARSEY